jgi:hypothetical protein
MCSYHQLRLYKLDVWSQQGTATLIQTSLTQATAETMGTRGMPAWM